MLSSKNQVFSRRAVVLLLFKLCLFGIITARLFFLQIIKFREYRALSDKNSIKLLLLEPPRGLILDRNDVVLANNKINYQLYFYKERGVEFSSALDTIFSILDSNVREKEQILRAITRTGYTYPILIAENLSWKQVVQLKTRLDIMPSMYLRKGYMRHYPIKENCSHVIGYIGPEKNSQKVGGALTRQFRVGKSGTESEFNEILGGGLGNRKVEVNAHGVIIREISDKKAFSGQDIKLSIDEKLQRFVFERIGNNHGAVIILDIKTNEVLALVSKPTFDPNIFASRINQAQWKTLRSRTEHYPLINRAISKVYPPASTWKIISALAGLEAGISPGHRMFCSGSMRLGDKEFKCWKEEGHQNIDLHDAITTSCNVYFYNMIRNIGINSVYKIADELGFGKKTGIDLPAEATGVNPNSEWKQKRFKKSWRVYDTINASTGHGYVMATPIQLVMMISKLIRGDKATPTIIFGGNKDKNIEKLNIPAHHLEFIKNALIDVVNQPGSSAYASRIDDARFAFGGKTGTAQAASINFLSGIFSNKVKANSLFAGFAPISSPRYAIAVTLDNAGWGSAVAAPMARDILRFTQTLYQ